MSKRYLLAMPGISLILLALPMVARQASWLALGALVPFIYFSQHCGKLSVKTIVRAIFVPSLLYGLATFAWVLQTSPSSWTAIQGNFAVASKLIVWLFTALLVAGGFWLLGKYVAHFRKKPDLLIWSLPVVWAVAELARVFSFSIVFYGPGASLSPNWNLGLAGLPLMATSFSYASRFLGLYGMSMMVVCINIAIYLILIKRWFKPGIIILTSAIVLSLLGYVLYRPDGRSITVSAVHLQTNESLDAWPIQALPARDAELIVVPEYSLFFQMKDYQSFAVRNFNPHSTLITSQATMENPSLNVLTVYSPQKGVISRQPKTFLIPGGEYMPYLVSGMFKVLKQDYLVKVFNDSQQVRRGPHPEHIEQLGTLNVGSLVCSGVISLSEYRRLTDNGAQILTNSASLSLIASASLYHEQESYLSKFHAVSNARPFVQASRSGESYILNSDGSYLARTKGSTKSLSATVRVSSKKTIYSMIGEWTLLAGPLLLIGVNRRLR